ncbi:Cell division inhibitor MinC [Granulibacter bethesdensis]|nr:Cell division inhibitor MinC [Granulibacter bethesdensis]
MRSLLTSDRFRLYVSSVTSEVKTRPFFRVRGRSFIAVVLVPEQPVHDWLGELDAQIERSPSFFDRRPVVVDLSVAGLQEPGLMALFAELEARNIRPIGIEGLDEAEEEWSENLLASLPPVIRGSRAAGDLDIPEETRPEEMMALVVERPVRSGQSVVHDKGDVIVIGSVASGAEVVAGGSIHVYGTLRGRAIAGLMEDGTPRIFCSKLEAELVAIEGVWKTADDMEPSLRGKPVQIMRDGETIKIVAFD